MVPTGKLDLGNKGGVVVRIKIHDTVLVFMCCHLEAH